MSVYIGGVAIAALAVSLALHITHEQMRSATRVALGLVLILAVAAPVADLVGGLSDIDLKIPNLSEGEENSAYEEVAESAFADGICKAIEDEFGISSGFIEVGFDGFDFEKLEAERIYVTLTGRGALGDPRAVREYVENNFGGKCVVEIEIG